MKMNVKDNYVTTKKERVSNWSYFFGQNIIYGFLSVYVQVYFTDIGITAAAVSVIFLIARIWDAVNDPMFGIIVDRSRLKSGRFIPWIRIASIAVPLFTALLFAIPSSLPIMTVTIVAGLLYILWGMSYTVSDVPMFALTTSMTGNMHERVSILSGGRLTGVFGMILAMVAAPVLRPRIGWFPFAVLVAAISLLTMLPISFTAKERMVSNDSEATSLKSIFRYVKGNKYLLIFYGAVIISCITNVASTVSVYFARINLGDESLNSLIYVATMLPMLIMAALLPRLTKRFDKMKIYITGVSVGIVFGIISYFAGYDNLALYLVLSFFRGAGSSMSLLMMSLFSADCVEYGMFKTGTRAEGITFSIQTFATKMYSAIAGALGMILLAGIGFAEGTGAVQPQGVAEGIWFLSTIFPVFGLSIALVILLFKYKLNDKDVQIMTRCNQGEITRGEALESLSQTY